MNSKNFCYITAVVLFSTVFGCKNNKIPEKMSDFNFLEKYKITCQSDPSRKGCSMDFNYKAEKINFTFVRDYEAETNKITIRKIRFQNDSSAGFFYGQILSDKSRIHFPFNDFNHFVQNLTIVYSNNLNTIDIQINDGSKAIILNNLKKFTKEYNIQEDEAYLNTLESEKLNYNDLKQLQFISEDFSVLEAFLLEISRKNKEDIIPLND